MVFSALLLTLLLAERAIRDVDMPSNVTCRPTSPAVRLPELPEASGVAASRLQPGRAWTHNDSGSPVLTVLSETGTVAGRVGLDGAAVEDWEAVAVGPCTSGSCVYVGDIGDNEAERERITIYRVPEAAASSQASSTADVFHAAYPDGPHDAETLLAMPDGRLFVVTKGSTGPVALFRFPRDMRPGAVAALEAVGRPREQGEADPEDRITDGAVSPDGSWVVLRTSRTLRLYRASDLLAGNWREAGRVDLGATGEQQGEGVTFASGTILYLVGEGGSSRAGTFVRLACRF